MLGFELDFWDYATFVTEGRGDIAAANLTITPERRKQVDFSTPLMKNVSELVVTGPKSPPIASVDDLSGKEVFVRRSSHYYTHLEQLNQRLRSEGKRPARLRLAPENLEDEDRLEMVNAGHVRRRCSHASAVTKTPAWSHRPSPITRRRSSSSASYATGARRFR